MTMSQQELPAKLTLKGNWNGHDATFTADVHIVDEGVELNLDSVEDLEANADKISSVIFVEIIRRLVENYDYTVKVSDRNTVRVEMGTVDYAVFNNAIDGALRRAYGFGGVRNYCSHNVNFVAEVVAESAGLIDDEDADALRFN